MSAWCQFLWIRVHSYLQHVVCPGVNFWSYIGPKRHFLHNLLWNRKKGGDLWFFCFYNSANIVAWPTCCAAMNNGSENNGSVRTSWSYNGLQCKNDEVLFSIFNCEKSWMHIFSVELSYESWNIIIYSDIIFNFVG